MKNLEERGKICKFDAEIEDIDILLLFHLNNKLSREEIFRNA